MMDIKALEEIIKSPPPELAALVEAYKLAMVQKKAGVDRVAALQNELEVARAQANRINGYEQGLLKAIECMTRRSS